MIQVPQVGKLFRSIASTNVPSKLPNSNYCSTLFQWLTLPEHLAMHAEATDNSLTRTRSLNGAKLKRQREFELGRQCATHAMQQLGLTGPVLVDTDRSPVWPAGATGSISHSSKFTWAAVAAKRSIQSVGIDTEPTIDSKVLASIKNQIVSEEEWETAVASPAALSEAELFTAIFSAKEAYYKCLYQVEKRYFDFRDAVATVVSDREILVQASLKQDEGAGQHSGRRESIGLRVYFEFAEASVFSITWMPAGELAWS